MIRTVFALLVFVSNPMTDAIRAVFPDHEHNIVGAFAAMPEDKFGFRPTPDLMPFGQLALHIAGANFYYCHGLLGGSLSMPFPKPTAPKAELVALLQKSFDYCRPAIANAQDVTLGEPVALGPQRPQTPRAVVLLEFMSGLDHHYAQAAGYLRLSGVLPPTATPAKDGGK